MKSFMLPSFTLLLFVVSCESGTDKNFLVLETEESALKVSGEVCDIAPTDGCCSLSELEPFLENGKLHVNGDLKLCSGQIYDIPIELRNVQGTAHNPITLDCSNSYIWGGTDWLQDDDQNFGIRVVAMNQSERVSYIDIENCIVAGWKTGIQVTQAFDPFDPNVHEDVYPVHYLTTYTSTWNELLKIWVGRYTWHDFFDHRDMPLPTVADHINLTNVTVHRNLNGLDYQGRDARIEGFRSYRNRGHGIHLAPHARNLVFDDRNGSFTFNVYKNGHPDVKDCEGGMFTKQFCDALDAAASNYFTAIAIDSGHNITLRNGSVNYNGRHGVSIYKNCGEHPEKEYAYHRRALLDRNILLDNMTILNHFQDYRQSGYVNTWEMVSSAGVMIGGRQGLKLGGQNGCHDLSSYVYTDGTDWRDITWGNVDTWHHWDFAQGVTIKGGAIGYNRIGVHVADSNARLMEGSMSDIKFYSNPNADVFVGNYMRDDQANLILSGEDTFVGAPPVKNVDLSGVPYGANVVCTDGTYAHTGGVVNGGCDLLKDCVEELVGSGHNCGSR